MGHQQRLDMTILLYLTVLYRRLTFSDGHYHGQAEEMVMVVLLVVLTDGDNTSLRVQHCVFTDRASHLILQHHEQTHPDFVNNVEAREPRPCNLSQGHSLLSKSWKLNPTGQHERPFLNHNFTSPPTSLTSFSSLGNGKGWAIFRVVFVVGGGLFVCFVFATDFTLN